MDDGKAPPPATPRWLPWALWLLVPAVLLLAGIARWGKPTAAYYLRDVQVAQYAYKGGPAAQMPVSAGIVSQLGIVVWAAATAVAAFAWLASRGRPARIPATLLPGAALLSLLLLADDGFLLHDQVFPEYLRLPQWLPLVPEGLLAAWFAWTHWRWILDHRPPLLFAAAALLATSLGADAAWEAGVLDDGLNLLEDGSKFLGAITWLLFVADVAADGVGSTATAERAAARSGGPS